jgi:DNA-binding NtrC family response regulator
MGKECLTGSAAAAPEETIRDRLLAQTPSLAGLAKRVALAAAHEVTVLLTGETGTGKTYLARLLHEVSPRRAEPFLVVPCGALAASLIDSELFGHVKGAFTGAAETKKGKFAAAGRGTILLDEIDALGLEQQAKLLRVVETGEFEPVGGNTTQVCQARILAASNWDLDAGVSRGRFRHDLYYRLNVFSFHLPPLRERVQDIAPLAAGLTAKFAAKFGTGPAELSPEALRVLETYRWPGNIRQLENVLQQGVLIRTGPRLLPEHLPAVVRAEATPARRSDGLLPGAPSGNGGAGCERQRIERALAEHDGHRARTAAALGMSRATLYKRMKSYGLLSLSEAVPQGIGA